MEERIRQCLTEVFDADVAQHTRLDNLGGHASLRIYWRIHLPTDLEPPRTFPRGESTLMAMVLPHADQALRSDEGTSSSDPVPGELPFVDVQRYLADIGMPVPAIDHIDMDRGVLFLEDLGDEMFENAVLEARTSVEVIDLYREAIDLLVKFQQHTRDADESSRSKTIAWQRSFDAELLRWELDHYREWGLEARQGIELEDDVRAELEGAFDQIVEALIEAPGTLVLRDYQSRNIMRKRGTWIMIDFQDALVGPCVYDLVALLRDSYIVLESPQLEELLDHYTEAGKRAGLPWCADSDEVRRLFHLQTLQRKLKDAGRFIFIDRVKNNPSFLDYYEPSIGYVRYALEQLPEQKGLRALLEKIEPAF
ncbi:MAG: aminoglycoside phosphotransferase family protein [Bradymonadaceae bacterium]